MNRSSSGSRLLFGLPVLAATFAFGIYAQSASAAEIKVKLSGDQEAPPIKSMGSGSGTFTIGSDMSVHGGVTTKGVPGTAAHIHEGATGKNGPIVIPLTKGGENTWNVPAGSKLTTAQYKAFQAGHLYVNVHTKAHPAGEVRGQLKP